jgi:hypothetical protein
MLLVAGGIIGLTLVGLAQRRRRPIG